MIVGGYPEPNIYESNEIWEEDFSQGKKIGPKIFRQFYDWQLSAFLVPEGYCKKTGNIVDMFNHKEIDYDKQ